jgi:hypothetical protein
MAVTFNATPGATDANSYVTVEGADEFLTERRMHVGIEWTALSQADKEAALMWSTREIERHDFIGTRQSSEQALHWPTFEQYENDGRPIPDDGIPISVEDATSEMALHLVKEDQSKVAASEQFEKVKVGPIELQYRDRLGDDDILATAPPDVRAMLKPVLSAGTAGGVNRNVQRR